MRTIEQVMERRGQSRIAPLGNEGLGPDRIGLGPMALDDALHGGRQAQALPPCPVGATHPIFDGLAVGASRDGGRPPPLGSVRADCLQRSRRVLSAEQVLGQA